MMRVVALVASLSLAFGASGCFGYNRHAKSWAYVGDTILLVGGGAAIAADQTSSKTACMPGPGCESYSPPIGGGTVVGAVLVTSAIIGYVINATRPTVKTSR